MDFRELLTSDQIIVFDGAMGTQLYSKGVYINRSYDELSLSNPDLVREVHEEYIRAGADVIETNTFGATAHNLQQYGLDGSLHEINVRAAQIARAAADERAYVAGAIGPLGLRIEPYGPTSFDEAKEMFQAQAAALLEGGVDLFVLETFSDVSEIRQALRAVPPRRQTGRLLKTVPARVEELTPADVHVVPPEERSNWSRKIARGEFVTTVEVLPPKGCEPDKTLASIRLLKEAGVDAVNIPDGPRAQTRMSAQATALLVEREIGLETVLHYCCRDRNLLGMMSDLLGAAALGLRNLLLITGDPPKMGPYPESTAVFDIDSIGLTNMVSKLNHGLDLGNNPTGTPTSFCIGVGVNPGALNLEEEIKRLEWKVEAGAEFAITQPVFDVGQLVDFLRRIEHVRVPVVAGIWPLVSYRNAEFLHNEVPGVVVTPSIMERMRAASEKGKEAGREEGLQIARELLLEVRGAIQGVQVSAPFNNVRYALDVFEALPEFARRQEEEEH